MSMKPTEPEPGTVKTGTSQLQDMEITQSGNEAGDIEMKNAESDAPVVREEFLDALESQKNWSEPAKGITDITKTKRTEGFDIKNAGKATIMSCQANENGNNLTSKFDWELPNLGNEANNYQLISVNASYCERGKEKITLTVVENRKAQSVCLAWGKTYTFTVSCNFMDLVTQQSSEACTTQSVSTEIGQPRIDLVEYIGKEIKLHYSKAKGASKHILKIMSEDNKAVFTSQPLESEIYKVKMDDPYSYGKTCTFVIVAICHGGGEEKNEKTALKTELIGGKHAVTNVIAKKNRRRVTVTWMSPQRPPKKYNILLFDMSQRETELVDEVEQIQTSHCFTELKCETLYLCRVHPVYHNGKEYDGTMSNLVKIGQRKKTSQESRTDFGKTEQIVHKTTPTGLDIVTVEVSWSSVQVGENFKVTGYNFYIEEVGRVYNSKILAVELNANTTKLEVKDLQKGHKYSVKISTRYRDLDSWKLEKATANYAFSTNPGQASMNDCLCSDGIITFDWKPVTGASKYQLLIKDEFQSEDLALVKQIEVRTEGRDCKAEIPTSEKLRIGVTCATKVIVFAGDNFTSQSDWKTQLIGGSKVPRNVKAARNPENPKRWVHVAFDHPRQGSSSEYKIEAIPQCGGRRKIKFVKTTPAVFDYLRAGVTYKFEVSAKWNNQWSTASESNLMCTDGSKANQPLFAMSKMGGSTVDLSNSTVKGVQNMVNFVKGEDFGKVRDIIAAQTGSQGEQDFMALHWKDPSFDNNSSDYKVDRYVAEVRKKHATSGRKQILDFVEEQFEYSTTENELELGELYDVSVSTMYEDIDQDRIFMSSAAHREFYTRPCKPKINRHDCKNDCLTIEWNDSKGAQRYEVELYEDSASTPTIVKDMQKETVFTKKFNEKFGYGTTYKVTVIAYGYQDKKNSSSTDQETIGGDYVPTNIIAKNEHSEVKDPNTQVFLSWTAPILKPNWYTVSADPEVADLKVEYPGVSCLVSGLNAGTWYYFKVMAIHQRDGKEITSGACSSKRIQTNPKPSQVKNIWWTYGENHSTSANIFWDKVGAENEEQSTKYRVCLTKSDEKIKSEVTVYAEKVTFEGLEPGSTYFVTVAGGNSFGYGRDSDKFEFKTDLGTPKNVSLLNNGDDPSSSLILRFLNAEGHVVKYMAVLHKYQDRVKHQEGAAQQVQSGHTFSDLDPNSEYSVEVYAVFATAEGNSTESKAIMTAPPKTVISEYGCVLGEARQMSSRKIFAKWNSEARCNFHRIRVKCRSTGNIESQLLLENTNDIVYCCLNEAAPYSIQVQSRNASGYFGKWSDEVVMHLAPAKLEGVSAVLEENGNDILVQSKTALRHSPFYWMRALCDGTYVDQPKPAEPQVDNRIVEWKFSPPENAQKYIFELWAADETKGESTFSNPTISRPSQWKLKAVTVCEVSPSSDIEMVWEPQDRCDWYEINICAHGQRESEAVIRTKKTSYRYRCQSPGNTYLVSLRANRESVRGVWCQDLEVTLAPAEVKLNENPKSQNDPVKCIQIEWERLEVPPNGYLVKLFCNDQEVNTVETTSTMHSFEGELLKPGSLCYCTVSAFNGNKVGQTSRSKNYRIEWLQPSYFSIIADDNELSRRAKMKWGRPNGVDCFKLEIENNETGVVTTINLTDTRYVFESGIPGNTYTARLYCGCDNRYDIRYIQETITMKPEPPTDVRVRANEQVKGLTIEFKDTPSIRKQYEISVESLIDPKDKIRKKTSQHSLILRGLLPGESYKVTVSTIIGESRSNEATSEGYISTLPDEVKNLRSIMEKGSILFEWNKLEIKPSKYIVQWRVDNEPITEEHTQATSFTIFYLKPAQCYSARVMAANSSGVGPMSDWENYITEPKPPSDIRVIANEQVKGLTIEFNDTPSITKQYEITAQALSDSTHKIRKTNSQRSLTLRHLVPGESYKVSVTTIIGESRSNEATSMGYISTLPDEVGNLRSIMEKGSILFEWDKLEIRPSKYMVQWRVDNEPISEEHTQATSFMIFFLKPAHCYSARVMAANNSGVGPMSDWENFITDPSPPYGVKVYPDPESPKTSLIVKYQDEKDTLKRYRITAEGPGEEPKTVVTHEHFAILSDLKPGTAYMVKVQTLFCGKESVGAPFSRI